ncbi:MAG: ABC-F type ribosomal protection protein [Planctomycetaceae bacterium]|jgi:lincosamide and streptogramin A transport system ATP-binding/permease protein|nr:ABC-F type ribosomal protection protein [Planctomycetaceae bacterium]
MPSIRIADLTFAYGGDESIFNNVSLQIETTWRTGLIGRNGRGKTTLLQLLSGNLEYSGTISSPLPFEYFPYAVNDKHTQTIAVVRQLADFDDWQLERELSLLEADEKILQRTFDTLSGGEQTKVLLAALFLKSGTHFLLIDEPTNHLDTEGRRILGNYLKRKSGFLLVSHDRSLLDNCVDHILSLNRSDIELLKGNFSTWQQKREYHDKFEQAVNEKLRKDIKQLQKSAQQTAAWSDKTEQTKYGSGRVDTGYIGAKSAKMMQRSVSLQTRQQKSIEEKAALFQNSEIDEPLKLSPLQFHSGRLLEIDDLTVQYNDKPLFEHLTFSVNAGERIALCGKNGCGKSCLLKLIVNRRTEGVRVPPQLKISYVPQDASFLSGNMRTFIEERQIDEPLFKAILCKFGFDKNRFDEEMSALSAGQKKKILLSASLCERAHLYLWDEPLNYIDVLSRIQIEKAFINSGAALLFVEHDAAFLEAVAAKRVML